jgi:AI-2 transport protein TqsA
MPGLSDEKARLITGSLVFLALIAFGWLLHFTRGFMIPLIIAVFIAAISSPLLDKQILRLKVPRPLAVLFTTLVIIIGLSIFCFIAAHSLIKIGNTAGKYSDNLAGFVEQGFDRLEKRGVKLEQEEIVDSIKEKTPGLIQNMAGSILGFISNVLLTLIFVVFLLAGRNPRVIRTGIYAEIDQRIRRYILLKMIVSSITGILVWITLTILKLELAGVFGVLTFLLNFIPSVGSIIATLLPIPVAVAQYDNPVMIILVIVIPGAIQMGIGNGIEPKLMGKGMDLHPITILLALSFWGLLWGIPGMFLAAPITAIIRIIFMQFDTLKPLGNLLAGELPGAKPPPGKPPGVT